MCYAITTLLPDAEQHCLIPAAIGVQSKTSETEERGELVAVLVGAAVAFGVGIYATLGADKAAEYFAGYLLEQSLSVDNLFVFVLIFDYFKVDQEGQDKVRLLGLTQLPMCSSSECCGLLHPAHTHVDGVSALCLHGKGTPELEDKGEI